MRHRSVGHAAIWVTAVRYAGTCGSARRRAVGPATGNAVTTGHAAVARYAIRRATIRRATIRRATARREPPRLARVRASWLAEPLLPGRHLARAAQQLPVSVVLGVCRSA